MSSPLLSNDLLLAQNVAPQHQTGVAQDSNAPPPSSGGGGGGGSALTGMMPILMMLVFLVPFFLLMSRRQKKEQAARASLKKGDRVTTNAGIIGELVEMDDRLARVKIAPGVTAQFVANTIAPFVDAAAGQKSSATSGAADLKEAKAGSDKK